MNQKHYQLLGYFLNAYGRRFFYHELAELMQVSERSVRNYISELNDFLAARNLCQIVSAPDKSLFLSGSETDRWRLLESLNSLDLRQYSLSHEERTLAIYLLLVSSQQATVQSLSDELCISKKTCLNDMKHVIAEFEKSGVVCKNTGRGYTLDISERFRRELIVRKLFGRMDISGSGGSHSGITTWINQYFHLDSRKALLPAIMSWQGQNGLILEGHQFDRFWLFIAVALFRIQRRHFVQLAMLRSEQTHDSDELALAEDLAKRLTECFHVEIPQTEVLYITELIERIVFPESSSDYWCGVDMQLVVKVFLVGVSQRLQIDIAKDTFLQDRLVTHIKTSLQLLSSGEPLTNHFKYELTQQNPQLYLAVKENICILERSFHCKYGEDAITFVMLHIIAAVERDLVSQPVRAFVVCNAGVATGLYLVERLRNYCRLDILASLPAYKLEAALSTADPKPDLIISTIPLPDQKLPVMTIPALPSEQDLMAVQSTINHIQEDRCKFLSSSTLQNSFPEEYMPHSAWTLRDIFPAHSIDPQCNADTWQDAIRAAGQLLLKQHHIGESYIEEMIQNVEVNGPYIVFFPGIALAHAAPPCPDAAFHASIVRLTQPVRFGHETNDPVRYVIAFVSSDQKENNEKMFAMINLLSSAKRLQPLVSAVTPEEFLLAFEENQSAVPDENPE